MSIDLSLSMEDRDTIRRLLESNRAHNDTLAVSLFIGEIAMFVAVWAAAVLAKQYAIQIGAEIIASFLGLRLLTIGHDAAHQSFTSSRRLNRFIGRVSLLPALQPLATWELAHNVIHHSSTNIRGKDYVWIPFSTSEYDALQPWRRWLERIYRGPFGHGLYYLIELWWTRVVIPSTRWNQIIRPSQRFDIRLTAGAAIVWGLASALLGVAAGRGVARSVVFGEIIPFFGFCQAFGWTLYLQHTHPRTQFYRDRSDWEFYSAQAANSTHIEFPKALDRLLLGAFDHTAHHLDVKVPFYRLREVEQQLDQLLRGHNIVIPWSWREFANTIRTCKLYDYERHCWLDFDGRVTAAAAGEGGVTYEQYCAQSSFSKLDLIAHANGKLIEGPCPEMGTLPAPPMLMFDRIVEVQHREHRGSIIAEQDVDLAAWYFWCHFRHDPVQPGCLGVDAIWQLLGFYLTLRGAHGVGRALGCAAVDFSGQIRPHNRLVRYEVEVKRCAILANSSVAIGDARVLVDGIPIYSVSGARVGSFRGIQYADYPRPSENSVGGASR